MQKLSSLSIFFPFWNEEKNIEKVVSQALSIVGQLSNEWEIILVDDGSSDKTLSIAREFAKKNKRIRIVEHKKNRGYGAALKSGLEAAKYDFVLFTDGDGQFDFSQNTLFVDKIKNADIVIGYRDKRFDNAFRHVLMNLLKIWNLLFFGFYFKDIDCGFKMFRKSAILKIMPLSCEGAMITTEILAKARRAHLTIEQVRVSHYKRKFGNQSGGNPRVIFRAIKESFLIRKSMGYGRI